MNRKIMHVVPFVPLPPNIGGLETYLETLCHKSLEQGNMVSIVGRTRASISKSIIYEKNGIKFYILPLGRFPQNFPINFRKPDIIFNLLISLVNIYPALLWCLRDAKPDIIHFYEFYHAPFSLICRLLGHPTILGHFVFQLHWPGIRKKLRYCSAYFIFFYPLLRCFSIVYTQAKTLVNSSRIRYNNLNFIKRIVGHNRGYYLPGCVDPDRFKDIKPDLEIEILKRQGFTVILCPRRLVYAKGVHYLLWAIPKTLKKTEWKSYFIFTGNGPLLSYLKKECIRLGISNNVLFTGNISYKSVISLMASSDIIVIPSISEETLGISILEAYALNKPVIGTRYGGIPDVIEDNHSGLLVEPANSEELSIALIKLIHDSELRNYFGKMGIHLIENKFSIQRTICKLDLIYKELVKRNTIFMNRYRRQ